MPFIPDWKLKHIKDAPLECAKMIRMIQSIRYEEDSPKVLWASSRLKYFHYLELWWKDIVYEAEANFDAETRCRRCGEDTAVYVGGTWFRLTDEGPWGYDYEKMCRFECYACGAHGEAYLS
jgi:hypothetical protein